MKIKSKNLIFYLRFKMIMDRMRKAVLDKVSAGSPFAQALFNFAFDYKLKLIKKGYDTPLLNR